MTLGWTVLACGSTSTDQTQGRRSSSNSQQSNSQQSNSQQSNAQSNSPINNQSLQQGTYPVQQAQYNDATGEYTLVLLNNNPPIYRTANLQMARLTDEQIQAGQNAYAEISDGGAILYIPENFQLEYVHNVTEEQVNPQTGQTETVVVRRESNFWSPFAGSFVGTAIANSLFAPRYYVPPVYQSRGPLVGYGGYGSSYDGAVKSYSSRYQAPPPAVKNRSVLRTSGTAKSSDRSPSNRSTNNPVTSNSPNQTPTSNPTNRSINNNLTNNGSTGNSSTNGGSGSNEPTDNKTTGTPANTTNTDRSTGSGVGASDLRRNDSQGSSQKASPSQSTKKRSPSFGSGGTRRSPSSRPRRSSGGRRRRR
ncbi:MAG: hypothetical protein ACFBSC_04520 [Microcoleaceae cyanobacterium]